MSLVSEHPVRLNGIQPQAQEPGKRRIAIPVTLTEDVVEALTAAAKAGTSSGASPLRISFNGPQEGAFLVGDGSFAFTRQPDRQDTDTSVRELWATQRKSDGAPNPLIYYANVAPKIDLKREVSAKLIQKLKEKRALIEEERKAREIKVLKEEPVAANSKKRKAAAPLPNPRGIKKIPPPFRPASATSASTSSQARATAIATSAKASPLAGTKTPTPSGTTTPATGRAVAPLPTRGSASRPSSPDSKLQKRLICRLADRPLTLAQLAKMLGAPPERIKPFLDKVAKPNGAAESMQQWTLMQESYRLIDWTSPELDKLSLLAKENVATNTQRAYDALSVPTNAAERGELKIFLEKVKSTPVAPGLGISSAKASPSSTPSIPAPAPAPAPIASTSSASSKPASSGPTVTGSGLQIGQTLTSTFRGGVVSKDSKKETKESAGASKLPTKKATAADKLKAKSAKTSDAEESDRKPTSSAPPRGRPLHSPDVHVPAARHNHSPAAPSPLAKSSRFDDDAAGYASSAIADMVAGPRKQLLMRQKEEQQRKKKRLSPSDEHDEAPAEKRRKTESGVGKSDESSRERNGKAARGEESSRERKLVKEGGKAAKPDERKLISRDTAKGVKLEDRPAVVERKTLTKDPAKAAKPEDRATERKALIKDAIVKAGTKLEEHSVERKSIGKDSGKTTKSLESTLVEKKSVLKRKQKTEDDAEDEYLPTAKKRKSVVIKDEPETKRPIARSKAAPGTSTAAASARKSAPGPSSAASKEAAVRKVIDFTDTEEEEEEEKALAKSLKKAAPPPKVPADPPNRAALNIKYHKIYAEYIRLHSVIMEQQDALQRYVDAAGEEDVEMNDPEETDGVVRQWQKLHNQLEAISTAIEAMDRTAAAARA